MSFLTVLLLTFSLLVLHRLVLLVQQIRNARRLGLHYIISPVYEDNPLLQLALCSYTIQCLIDRLPLHVADYINSWTYRTRWKVGNRVAERYGGVYATVSPGTMVLEVADAKMVEAVVKKRLPKPIEDYESLRIYGGNVVASEGQEWVHHRRHTAGTFNERNNKLVWAEAIQHTTAMLSTWQSASSSSTPQSIHVPSSFSHGFLMLAFHVIASSAFNIHLSFSSSSSSSTNSLFSNATPAGFTRSFRSATHYLAEHFVVHVISMVFLPKWCSWLPVVREHHTLYRDLIRYYEGMVKKAEGELEDEKGKEGKERDTLLRAMVERRAPEVEEGVESEEDGEKKTSAAGLTTKEIIGNCWIFSIAGQETSAKTMHYALLELALHPEQQEWVYRNIMEVLGDKPVEEWDYEKDFPKLVAPLCLMLETLRLYAVVPSIPKSTVVATTIDYANTSLTIPAHIYISLHPSMVHRSTSYYGPTATLFDCTRWDASNSSSFLASTSANNTAAAGLEFDTVHKPARGAYLPFSDGVRACLGKKFAQVEFVGVFCRLLREWRVEIQAREGEGEEEKRERVRGALGRSSAQVTLGVVESVEVVLRKREGVVL